MRLRLGMMVRGNGVAYIEVRVSGLANGEAGSPAFSAYADRGTAIPVEAYPREDDDTGRAYVLAIPLLDVRSYTVVAEAGGLTARARLLSAHLTWASRYHYLRHGAQAALVRDVDKRTAVGQVHLEPLLGRIAPDATLVAKLTVSVPLPASAEDVAIRVLDGSGAPVCLSEGELWVSQARIALLRGVRCSCRSLTLRVPAGTTRCVVASVPSVAHAGLYCLNAAEREKVCGYGLRFWRPAEPGVYPHWLAAQRGRHAARLSQSCRDMRVPICVVVVAIATSPAALARTVESVRSQALPPAECVVVADAAVSVPDDVSLVSVPAGTSAGEALAAGVAAARGEWCLLVACGYELDGYAVSELAAHVAEHPGASAVYADEDEPAPDGSRTPNLKGGFNVDLLRSTDAIGGLLMVRTDVLRCMALANVVALPPLHDIALRLFEEGREPSYLPAVLAHRCEPACLPKSLPARRRAVEAHLARLGIAARVEDGAVPGTLHVAYEATGSPLVSLIIPNKDCAPVLERCIDSIERLTDWPRFEVLVIENNSVEAETFACYERLSARYDNVRVLTWDAPFNYAAINNFAVREASGEYLLLLNSDTEVRTGDWMRAMLGLCQREDVGAVGARLLYPDGTVQHGGVVMAHCPVAGEVAGPVHLGWHDDAGDPGYRGRSLLTQDMSAVTAACLMTPRSVWDSLGGLDEGYAVAFNDVDFCLRVREAGLLVVFEPAAELTHYESLARGGDGEAFGSDNLRRYIREQSRLRERWSAYYANGDPYFGRACTTFDPSAI